jgi:nitrate reductase molybdenum cofactor assembly chaperone NarJ/NarW
MLRTYRALALLLSYPTDETCRLAMAAVEAMAAEARLPPPVLRALAGLAGELAGGDFLDLQERYVWLFDRTRSLSLNLYEHVHGESRDRGAAMAALLALYREHGLELHGAELPDHLPVFLDFLSTLPAAQASSLLGEAAHVLAALGERLDRRASPYRAVFAALAHLSGERAEGAALKTLLAEPDDDPADLATMDRLWAEVPVTFGPGESACGPAAGRQI